MARIVEQVVAGVLNVLSRADEKFESYHQRRRGEMRLEYADREAIERSIAERAARRARSTPWPPVPDSHRAERRFDY